MLTAGLLLIQKVLRSLAVYESEGTLSPKQAPKPNSQTPDLKPQTPILGLRVYGV